MKSKKIIIALLVVLALFAFAACDMGTSGSANKTPGNYDGKVNYHDSGGGAPGDFNNTNDADRNVTLDGTKDSLEKLDNDNWVNP